MLDLWVPRRIADRRRARLGELANVRDYPPFGDLPDRLGHGDMIVVDHDPRGGLAALPRLDGLRLVQTMSAGVERVVDHVPAGVTLCNASGVHDVGVTEWIMLAILGSFRHLPRHVRSQAAGTWRSEDARGDELHGTTVLILGYGSIGRALEARLRPFGVEIVRVARTPRDDVRAIGDLPTLVMSVDVVVILLPLTPETRGLVGADVLDRMRPGTLLVNASRGAVVDTEALMRAVSERNIRAALDVTEPEPLPDGHPLWSMPGVLITPHIAGDVAGEEDRAWQLVADQVGRLSRGDPLDNVVVDGY